jgi:retron-type reverse transcriptase
MDLEDFFPSIKLRRVIALFKRLGYPQNVSFYLSQLCCYSKQLPQGAATSPYLSNIIATKMDARLYGLSRAYGLNYTRYADDLTFSGPKISIKTIETIKKVVEDEGFKVNPQKTRLCRSAGKRIVTGISVSGKNLTIPREYKRELKQELHYVRSFGLTSHIARRQIRNPFYIESLYGKLIFWKWVEPDNTFVNQVIPYMREMLRVKQ